MPDEQTVIQRHAIDVGHDVGHDVEVDVEQAMRTVARMPHARVEEAVRGMYRAVIAYDRTRDTAHLVRLADDAMATVRLHEAPGYEKAMIEAPETPGDPAAAVDLADVLARLGTPK